MTMTRLDSVAANARARSAAFAPDPEPDSEPDLRREAISLDPATTYEVITRQMVLALREELREIKTRLNGLLFMVAGSVLLEVALRLAGVDR
jgi:hypothetical protein